MSILCEKDMSQKDMLHYLCDEQWSNAACSGYLIFTCEYLGYSEKQIGNLLNSMQDTFGNRTIEQAKKKFYNYRSK